MPESQGGQPPGTRYYRALSEAASRLERWLIKPSPAVINRLDRRQASLLAALLLGLLVMGTVWGVTWEIGHRDQNGISSDTVITDVSIVVLALLYALSRTAYFRATARLSIAMISIATFLSAIPDHHDATDSNLLVYLLLPVLFSSIILSVRATALLILVQTVGLLIYPYVFPGSSTTATYTVYITFTSLALLMGVRYWRLLEGDQRADLEASETRYRALFDDIDDAVFVHDLEGYILEVNAAACRRLGYSRADLLRMRMTEIEAPSFAAGFADRMARQLAEGGLQVMGGVHITRNGRRVIIDSNGRLITFQKQPAVLVVCRDMSEHARVEAVLAEVETRTRAMLTAFPDLIFRMNKDGVFLDYEADESISLYRPPEHFLGKRVDEVMSPEVARMTLARVHKALATNTLQTSEYDLPAASGEILRFEARSVPIDQTEVLTVVRDITQFTRAQARLRASEAEYRSLFEDSPTAMLEEDYSAIRQHIDHLHAEGVTDFAAYFAAHPDVADSYTAQIRVVNGNQAALALYQASSLEALVAGLPKFAVPEMLASFRSKLVTLAEGSQHIQVEAQHVTLAGERISVIVTSSLAPGYETSWGKVFTSIVDVTGLKRAEQAEREQRTLSDALRAVAAAINSTLDPEIIFDHILTTIGRVVPYETASIAIYERGEVRTVRSQGYDTETHAICLDTPLALSEHANLRQMIETLQPVLIADVRQGPDWITQAADDPMRSYLGAPIYRENDVLGFIHLQSSKVNFFTPDHAERLQVFADQVATALRNARLYEDVQRHASDLEALRQVSLDMNTQLDTDSLLTILSRRMVNLLGVEGGGLYLYRPERDAIERVVSVGEAHLPTGVMLKRGEGLSGLAWEQNSPVIVTDYQHWSHRARQYDGFLGDSVASVIGVPFYWRDQFLGVLNARANSPERRFTENDVRLLSLFGTQAAIALKNAQFYDEVQQHVQELDMLRRLTLDISSQLNLDVLLRSLVESAVRLVGVESGGLYLYRPEEDLLEWTVTIGPGVAPAGTKLRRGEGVSGKVLESGQPMILNDYAHWDGHAPAHEGYDWSAVIAVPIHWREALLGVVNVVAVHRVFNQHDVDLLSLFVNQAAITIQNAQLFAAEREQRAFSDALRDTAAAINSTLELDHVLDRILTNVERVVAHDAANIMLVEGDSLVLARGRGYERFGDPARPHSVRYRLDERPFVRRLVETGAGYVVPDTSTDPEWTTLELTTWIRSHMSVPIQVEGRVIGLMSVDSRRPHTFTENHLEALSVFADQAATAIHNARLYAEVRAHSSVMEQRVAERTADLSVRNAVAETISSSLDTAEMLNGVLHTTIEQLGVKGGAIYLLTDDGSALDMVAHSGSPPETLNLVTGIEPGQPDLDRLSMQPVSPGDPPPDITGRTGISAVLSVPIWRQEQVQGVIAIVHDQPRPWRPDETRMLDAIGRQIGVALSNARLYADALRDEVRLRTILQSVADGMLVFDGSGALILINPAAEALFGFYPAQAGGARQAAVRLWEWLRTQESGSVEFVMPDPSSSGDERVQTAVEVCRAQRCPHRSGDDSAWPCWLSSEGPSSDDLRNCGMFQRIARRSIQAQSAQVRPPGGDMQGTVIALHDVTYFRELDELKGRFVSTVSHELRTPLSAVLLQVSTLLKYYDRFVDSERRGMIAEVQQQAYVLRELIEDILELSRFDARRAMPQKQWFDLAAHCHDVFESLELAIVEKELHCEIIGIDAARYVLGDPNQLSRVVRNLLSNAIKYTPPQGTITLRLEQRGANVRLEVTDTGIGIAPDQQLYIFDRFFRTQAASEMASGTGLGLSITHEIVELHGGQIELRSVVGQGSTFTVTLPVAKGD